MYRSFSCIYLFALSTLLLLCVSCSSELDFDTTEDVVITPRLDLDLVFLTLETVDFEDQEIVDLQITLRDTTRLEFLNDEVTQENLKEIELQYIATNTFAQSLVNTSRFLNNNGDTLYQITFPVNASSNGEEVVTNFVQVIPEQDLDAIRNSIQLVNEVTLVTNGQLLSGIFTLKSKALYSLEFTDL